MLKKAIEFAKDAHKGQTRKNGVDPYIVHPIEVSEIIQSISTHEEEIVAAILHDVVEDTTISIDQIQQEFGAEVALIVNELTDTPEIAALPRAERKKRQALKIENASNSARKIKLADQISNLRGIAKDPSAWKLDSARSYIQQVIPVARACFSAEPELWPLFEKALGDAQDATK